MRQFSRFVLVGVFNTVLGYCVIFGCMYVVGLTPEASNVTGYAAGLIVSYLLNRKYTFSSRERQRDELPRFLVGFAICYGANLLVLVSLIRGVGMHAGASQLLAGAAYVTASYLINKHYVFSASGRSEA